MVDSVSGSRPRRPATVWVVALVYFSFAIPTSILGVMWPDVRARFGQSLGALGLVTLCYGAGRLSVAVSGRPLVARFGMGRAFVAALVALVAACACLATAVSWVMFLLAVGGIGLVSGVLDSIGSTFIAGRAIIADAGLLHGSYGLGATIGPIIVAAVSNWRLAVASGVVVAVAAAAVTASIDEPWPAAHQAAARDASDRTRAPRAAVAASVIALGALVAIEVSTGQWAYTYLTDGRDVGKTIAAIGVAGFWGAATVGRLVMSHAGVARQLARVGLPRLAAVAIAVFVGIIVGPAGMSIALLALAGLVLAPIVPSLFATTARRVGISHAVRASGWQLIATNVGALSVPALIGTLVDAHGPGIIPVVALAVLVAVGLPLLILINRLPDRSGQPARPVTPTW